MRAFELLKKDLNVTALVKALSSYGHSALEVLEYPAKEKLREINPLINEVTKLGKKVEKVFLSSLTPGQRIAPHEDKNDGYERYHIPIIAEPGNKFYCERFMVEMKPGELWKFDNTKRHWLYNGSKTDRIHLVVDTRDVN